MGASDLAAAPLAQYTLGFEFETVVTDPEEEYVDPLDMEADREQLQQEFLDQWESGGSTFNFEDWFENWIRSDYSTYLPLRELILDNAIDPVRPVSEQEAAEFENRQAADRVARHQQNIDPADFKEAVSLVRSYRADPEQFIRDDEQFLRLVFMQYNLLKNRNFTMQQLRDRLASIRKEATDARAIQERLAENAKDAALRLGYEFDPIPETADTVDMSEIYFYTEDDQILTARDVQTLDQVLSNFDVSRGELKDMTREEWQEIDAELMADAFNVWLTSHWIEGGTQEPSISYVKKVLRDELGVETSHMPGSKNWAVVADQTEGIKLAEIITPAWPADQALDQMQAVLDIIDRDPNLRTNRATGMHINIGTFTEQQVESIDWLKFLLIFEADRALKYFSRESNMMALDRIPEIITGLEKNNLGQYYRNVKSINDIVRSASGKFSAVNLSKLKYFSEKDGGIIEIRAPGNAGYEQRGDYIKQLIQRAIRALSIAENPAAYKKQYLSKLYRITHGTKGMHRTYESALSQYLATVFAGPGYEKMPEEMLDIRALALNLNLVRDPWKLERNFGAAAQIELTRLIDSGKMFVQGKEVSARDAKEWIDLILDKTIEGQQLRRTKFIQVLLGALQRNMVV